MRLNLAGEPELYTGDWGACGVMGWPETWLPARWWQRLGCVVVLAALAAAWTAVGTARPAHAATRKTVVSLTFDDGDADQMTAVRILHRYRLHGTFFVITGAVGTNTYVTRGDLRTMAADGDEIGDHTVSHLSLPKVSVAEARRQICGARDILTGWGFAVTSFAYPDATHTPAVEQAVRECGLNSARAGNGIRNGLCPDCADAETIPPRDPDAVRTPGQIDTSWTVRNMEDVVTNAERRGGGWIPFVFHHVCANPSDGNCGDLSISPAHFSQFVRWLAKHKHSVSVRTVHQAVRGPVRPEVHLAGAGPHGVDNASLTAFGRLVGVSTATESTGNTTGPSCWMYGGYGQNTVQWERLPGGHGGGDAERVTMISHTNGDAKLLQQFDTGQCSLPVTPGHAYQLSSWYSSTIRTQYAVYYRAPSGRWVYWVSSPYFRASGHWERAVWQTPPVPAGATGLSFGLDLESVGSLTTSGYSFQKAPIKPGVLAFRLILLVAVSALVARVVYTRRRPIGRAITRAVTRRPRADAGQAEQRPAKITAPDDTAELPVTTATPRGAPRDDA